MESILTVRNLETWYGPVNAIRGINLEVRRGRIVTVLGANGAGKTTLLNTIAGVIDPAKGSITFDGQAIACLDADVVARSGVALVPEGRQIFPFLTVRENLHMGAFARRHHPDVSVDLQRVFTWFPRLRERQEQAAGLLSGGEQQMLAIGRAWMGCPKLLLLDEPSLGLSPLLTREIFSMIRRINADTGVTVLVVEQNAAIALANAHDGYILELGRVVAADTCEALARKSDVREFYLGAQTGGAHSRPPSRWRRRKTWR